MKKIFLSVFTVLTMLTCCFSAFAVYHVYKDVAADDWFYDAVVYVSDKNVMNGVGNLEFSPKTELTRGMAVTVLSRICGDDVSEYTESPFNDVKMEKYYGRHIAWAKANGVVSGMSETVFEPDSFITREQVCVMLSNFLDFRNLQLRNNEREEFADADSIAGWAKDAVTRLHRGGMINGRDDGTFDPKGYVTRAEFAQILYNSNLVSVVAL